MSKKTIEETYLKVDHRKHILELPDTYIGSINMVCDEQFIGDADNKVIKKVITYNPGLIKIFDEVLVNAIDHSVRNKDCTNISVTIDKESGFISVKNNGPGIPVVMHKEHKVYVPELIFGNLLTSSNYDKSEEKIVGGKNGYGAKLCNIFSETFIIETVDSDTKKSYKQEFSNNMGLKHNPIIKSSSVKSYTKISFKPDYKRFGTTNLTDDVISLMKKRVYDCTACTNKNVSVSINGEKLNYKEFLPYTTIFFNDQKHLAYEKFVEGDLVWEVCAYISENSFQQVSFVNGIATIRGGKHVDCIVNQITTKLGTMITSKLKIENVKAPYIKDKLFVFVRSTVINPTFDTQTKETLTTHINKFGIKIELSDSFISKLYKSDIVKDVVSMTEYKNNKNIEKSSPNTSRKSRLNIEKLDDANWAGTKKSKLCTLILTEGDSAKTFAVSGYSVIGRDKYGVFPLRGKLLNVREATMAQISNNVEVKNMMNILGLQRGKKYTSIDNLRYGSILIMTDADVDGIHIRALIMNMISTWWPELLEIKGFIKSMKTPIIKATKGKDFIEFYTEQDYKEWENGIKSGKWNIKYYKGLGTSTAKEAVDLFKRLDNNTINFTSNSVKETDKYFLLAFEKKQTDNRKLWLKNFNNSMILDQSKNDISYKDFINKELIHFSSYDVVRSIPSICDGLKPSQRKIMFTMFKKNYSSEIKVSQFAASVSELSGYHHGEASLCGAIINLAQTYTGSNNWNLLKPNGQFGSRRSSGKDAASPRYIFTEISEHSKQIFNKDDLNIVEYKYDEGEFIEPYFYIPILPIILINGSQGIGTGYSCSIPGFNPDDIKDNILRILDGKETIEMMPWYNGYKGKIIKKDIGSFVINGIVEKVTSKSIRITEIPVGVSIDEYSQFIETLIDDNAYGMVNSINNSNEIEINILLEFSTSGLEEFLKNGKENILKILKLSKPLSTRNMHLFDINGAIKKYETADDILKEFVNIRLLYNTKRKEYLINKYTDDLKIIRNKYRFLNEIISGDIVVYKKSKITIEEELETRKYYKSDDSFDYLLRLPVYSFTIEKLKPLEQSIISIEKLLKEINGKTEKNIFLEDIQQFKSF